MSHPEPSRESIGTKAKVSDFPQEFEAVFLGLEGYTSGSHTPMTSTFGLDFNGPALCPGCNYLPTALMAAPVCNFSTIPDLYFQSQPLPEELVKTEPSFSAMNWLLRKVRAQIQPMTVSLRCNSPINLWFCPENMRYYFFSGLKIRKTNNIPITATVNGLTAHGQPHGQPPIYLANAS